MARRENSGCIGCLDVLVSVLALAAIISSGFIYFFMGIGVPLNPEAPQINVTYAAADLSLVLSFTNPNTKGGISYDRVMAEVVSGQAAIGMAAIEPFYQQPEETTLVRAETEAVKNVAAGAMSFDVVIKTEVTFSPEKWTAERYYLELLCPRIWFGDDSAGPPQEALPCMLISPIRCGVEVARDPADGSFMREAVCEAVTRVTAVEEGKRVRENHRRRREFLLDKRVQDKFTEDFIAQLEALAAAP